MSNSLEIVSLSREGGIVQMVLKDGEVTRSLSCAAEVAEDLGKLTQLIAGDGKRSFSLDVASWKRCLCAAGCDDQVITGVPRLECGTIEAVAPPT